MVQTIVRMKYLVFLLCIINVSCFSSRCNSISGIYVNGASVSFDDTCLFNMKGLLFLKVSKGGVQLGNEGQAGGECLLEIKEESGFLSRSVVYYKDLDSNCYLLVEGNVGDRLRKSGCILVTSIDIDSIRFPSLLDSMLDMYSD